MRTVGPSSFHYVPFICLSVSLFPLLWILRVPWFERIALKSQRSQPHLSEALGPLETSSLAPSNALAQSSQLARHAEKEVAGLENDNKSMFAQLLPNVFSAIDGQRSALMMTQPCCYPGIRCQKTGRPYKIIVSQGEKKTRILSWMYAPVRDTLWQGLKSRELECGYRTHSFVPANMSLNGKYTVYPERGDVIIHIGEIWEEEFARICQQDFALKEVYCIWYYLEAGPLPFLEIARKGVCEVWTYTHGNLQNIVNWTVPFSEADDSRLSNVLPNFINFPPLVRFVPPGFLRAKTTSNPRSCWL